MDCQGNRQEEGTSHRRIRKELAGSQRADTQERSRSSHSAPMILRFQSFPGEQWPAQWRGTMAGQGELWRKKPERRRIAERDYTRAREGNGRRECD